MRDLIERLEKAAGPDRGLDLDIAIATGVVSADVAGYGPYLRRIEARRCDPVTESIDAAVALVERVAPNKIMFSNWPGGEKPAVARLGRDGEDVRAATMPIALCIALLRAKEASDA